MKSRNEALPAAVLLVSVALAACARAGSAPAETAQGSDAAGWRDETDGWGEQDDSFWSSDADQEHEESVRVVLEGSLAQECGIALPHAFFDVDSSELRDRGAGVLNESNASPRADDFVFERRVDIRLLPSPR
jgi:hypothetical protein